MGVVENTISKRITGKALGNAVLDKLGANKGADNVQTITFPSDLQNLAQSTYMVIYILDNQSNHQTYTTETFNSGVDKESFEIPAITFLKEYSKQELERLKKAAKEYGSSLVKSGKEYLSEWAKDKFGDTVDSLKMDMTELKEAGEWANKWLVPRRVTSESKALKDSLDPTRGGRPSGYRLKKAIALQMPSSSLTYRYENGWESTDTSTLNTIRTLLDGVKNMFGTSADRESAFKKLDGVLDLVKDAVGDLLTGDGYSASRRAASRVVKNPVIVFNYTIPQPRTFDYSFALYPRNKEELYTLFNLIQELKFYALPEIQSNADKSLWYRYPAKFAVKFYTNGYENKWFPNTMALGLTSIEETLTGDGGDMAFFENYFDKESGNPPRVVKLTLRFKELGIMSRQYAQAGY